MQQIEHLYSWIVPASLTLALILFAGLLNRLLERHYASIHIGRQRRQLVMLSVGFCSMLLVIISLPISDSLRGQILSLIGILLSAAIALSSTTFVGNIMAGMMLSSIRGFRLGDFIHVGEHFGRVSERGLLHVEIQTEDRDLTTLPNLFLVTQPVKVVHAEGTVVSGKVSLGYDVPRRQVEACLLSAAAEAGLEDAFVGITELADFSVSYRIAGKLNQVKTLISTRSRLLALAMDKLHASGIEIVSPDFVALRSLAQGHAVKPAGRHAKGTPAEEKKPAGGPETMLFDKAELAESTERLREKLVELAAEQEALAKEIKATDTDEARRRLEAGAATLARKQERYEALLAKREES